MRASIDFFALVGCTPSLTPEARPTASATASSIAPPASSSTISAGPAVRSFFTTPSDSGLQPVLDAIAGAKKTIRMMMFHLTVPEIEAALVAAASRGVDVKIILDAKNLEKRGAGEIAQRLADHGVVIVHASSAFSLMHAKAMVVDDATCVIMSLNLTRLYDHARDFAIVTDDAGVIDEFLRVFDADVTNAEHQTAVTPALANAALVWSPVDAEARLVSLVDSAQRTVDATTENLGDHAMQDAFARATKRGVKCACSRPHAISAATRTTTTNRFSSSRKKMSTHA